MCTTAGSVSVFGVGIGIRYFRRYFFSCRFGIRYQYFEILVPRYSVSVTDPGLVCTMSMKDMQTTQHAGSMSMSTVLSTTAMAECSRTRD